MKTCSGTSSRNQKSRGGVFRLAAVVLPVALAVSLPADKATAQASSWDFTLDAALFAENVYVGSDEHYITPLPAFKATHSAGAYTYFLSLPLEGFGVSHVDEHSGLTSKLTMNFGGQRQAREYSVVGVGFEHSDRTRALLEGSPDVSTPVFVEAGLGYPTPVGILGAALGYHPTSIQQTGAETDKDFRHGFVLTMQYLGFVPLSNKLSLSGIFNLELMDGNYADAWYGVDQETAELDRFDSGAGLRDVQLALYANYQISEEVSLSLYGNSMILLGDAANSPFTVSRHQQTFLLRTSYSF